MPANPLKAEERDNIFAMITVDPSVTFAEIARHIGRHRSTISREVARHGGMVLYQPAAAGLTTRGKLRRPKAPKLADPSALVDNVVALITERHRPVAVLARRFRHGVPLVERAAPPPVPRPNRLREVQSQPSVR